MRTRALTAVAAVAALSLSLAACGSDATTTGTGSPAATTAADMPAATSAAPTTAGAMGAQFGAACSAVPTDPNNPGSFDAMAKVPVATAASGNPLLKTLVTAVTKAKLVDTLNSAPALTVFAPVDDAFGKIPADTLTAVLANDAQLKSILTYHVVGEKISPDQLAGTHKTLQGGEVTVTGSGSEFTVNGAKVLCGNVQTANATVYIIDTVMMPKA